MVGIGKNGMPPSEAIFAGLAPFCTMYLAFYKGDLQILREACWVVSALSAATGSEEVSQIATNETIQICVNLVSFPDFDISDFVFFDQNDF